MAKHSARREPSHAWRHIFIFFMMAFALFPIYTVIVASLNDSGALTSASFLPSKITWVNYHRLFTDKSMPFMRWVVNSLTLGILNEIGRAHV